jgi:osmotically inducible lipoprotein OsmB
LCPWLWAGDGWQHIDDTTVTAWVKTGIYKEPTLKSVDINAETFKGQVQLSDFVSTRSNMEHAGAAAKGVNGATARTTSGRALTALGLAVLMGLGGCAGISDRQQSTAAVAGIGAVSGSTLTGGRTIGALGRAAVGGIIGNESAKKT